MHEDLSGIGSPPELTVSRLVVVISGSAWATSMPSWVGWLAGSYPNLRVRVVLTRSARRFVTVQALAPHVFEVMDDCWPEDDYEARHVRLWEWAEAFAICPATFHYTARLAAGLADSPSLLAAQCTDAVVAVAPSLPPGGMDSAAFRDHWRVLAGRSNVALVPPGPIMSTATGGLDAWGPPPFPELVRLLEERRAELAEKSDSSSVECPNRAKV